MDWKALGTALQGTGAWFQGQGPAWERQQYEQRERQKLIEQEKMRREAALGQERAKNAALSFRSIGQLIDDGQIARAETVLGQTYLGSQGTPMAQASMQLYQMIKNGQTDQARQLISSMDKEFTTRMGLPGPEAPITVAKDAALVDPTTGREVFRNSVQEPVNYNQAFLPDGTPNQAFQDYQRSLREAGRPETTVNVGDNNYSSRRGGSQADQMTELERAALSAHRTNEDLDRFVEASASGDAGAFQPVMSITRSMLSSFGYQSEELSSNALMEQAIADILANKMSELGARGLTDSDMRVLQRALPQVETSREAREAIAAILKKSNTRIIQDYIEARNWEAEAYPELNIRTPDWLKQYNGEEQIYTVNW
jgi:hypothetical protein